jgi:spoIIIJ-associated protein
MEDSRDKQALDEGWEAQESAGVLAAQKEPAGTQGRDAAGEEQAEIDSSQPNDDARAYLQPAPQQEEPLQTNGEPNAGPGSTQDGERRGSRRRRRRPRDRDNNYEGDERAQQALAFVRTVVHQMGMDCRSRLRRGRPESDGSSPEIVIELSGRDSARIIGKKGQVLTALQFLTHRVVNRAGLERRHVLVDAEGYRMRRESSLASMARKLGKQAVDLGKIITFEPMNPRDRRVVHLALAKFEGVITKSDGEGDERRVQIIPVRR